MMRGELLCWDGRRIRLPDAVEWRFQYGYGTPCDSFQLTCLWEPDSGNDLAEAVSFTAEVVPRVNYTTSTSTTA